MSAKSLKKTGIMNTIIDPVKLRDFFRVQSAR